MKKYVWLAVGTLAAVGLIFGIRAVTQPQTVAVRLHTVSPTAVRQTVECTGKVQAADSEKVYVEMPCMAQEVYVSAGDYVKQGDPLFAVDVEATEQVLAAMGSSVAGSVALPAETVTAPVSGKITAVNVEAGALADTETPCAVIEADGGVRIALTVRERYVSRLAVGQAVEISGVAFDKELYHGTVSYIADTARQEYVGTVSETVVDAMVVLDEQDVDTSLRAGLNASATVITEVLDGALLVPYDCLVQNEEGKDCVYVYAENGTAVRCEPTFGAECRDGVLVVSGVSAGARLVCNPEQLTEDVVAVCEE